MGFAEENKVNRRVEWEACEDGVFVCIWEGCAYLYFTHPYPLFNVEPFHPLIILSSRRLPPFLSLFPLLLSLLPRESVPRHTNLASSSRLRSLHSISSLCLFPSPHPPLSLSLPSLPSLSSFTPAAQKQVDMLF